MRYWPTTRILANPAIRPEHALEISNYKLGISEGTLRACHQAAFHTMACTDMLLMVTEDVAPSRVYVRHPTQENWLTLERSGFVDTGDNFGFNVARLH